MGKPQNFEIVLISDTDEPGEAVRAGMERASFDGVLLALVPDGRAGDTCWYATPNTSDGRPTRPILLFYRGIADVKQEGLKHLSRALCLPESNVKVVAEWDRRGSTYRLESIRTLEVYTAYPPYPWHDAAAMGMQQGLYYDDLELIDWTEPRKNEPAKYVYLFQRSSRVHADV